MNLAGIQQPMIRGAQVILFLSAIGVLTATGQVQHPDDQTAPPPLKVITRAERSQINDSKDPKERIKTTLELAEAHLGNAENQTNQREYDGAAAEAGMYWALVEDAFSFMKTIKTDSNPRRDLYKRLELSLRAHGPRLTSMRRTTPSDYAIWIKQIEEFARNGRTEALNSFYGHTVIRDASQKPADPKQGEKP